MKYFLHDSNSFSDEKITQLYMEYGYEGLGLFYTLLEKFAAQEKPIRTDVLKKQLNVGKRLEKCWQFMEQIEIIHSSNEETFNEQLLNFSEKYKIKKQKNSDRIKQWRENQADAKNVTGYERVRNTPKVKESKINRNKVKESKDEIVFPFDSENFKEQWENWKQYKKDQHKFTYKGNLSEQAALKKLGELSQNSETIAIKIIHESISNGWAGFFKLKDNGTGNNAHTGKPDRLKNSIAELEKFHRES